VFAKYNKINDDMSYFAKTYLVIMILLVSVNSSESSDNLPYSYTMSEVLDGGKLFINDIYKNDIRSYFFKPNFNDDSEVLYTWEGIKRKNVKGTLFQYGYLMNAIPYKENIFAVWQTADSIYAGLIDPSASIILKLSLSENLSAASNNVRIKDLEQKNCIFVLVNDHLYSCCIKDNSIAMASIADNVSDFDISNDGDYDVTFILNKEANGLIYNARIENGQSFICRIPIFENVMLRSAGEAMIFITFPNNTRNSILRFIDSKRGILSEFNLEEAGDLIAFSKEPSSFLLYYIGRGQNAFSIFKSELVEEKELKNITSTELPSYFIEPMAMKMIDNTLIVIFRNGICTIDKNGSLQSGDIFPVGQYFSEAPMIKYIDEHLILSGDNKNIIFERKTNSFWMINSFLNTTGSAMIPIISAIIIFIFIQLYRHQKRLLLAVLNLPSSGIVFVVDKNGSLTKANTSGKKILGITNSIPLGKPFQFYCTLEHTKPINELVQKSLSLRDSLTQKLTIQEGDRGSKEWFCTSLPIRNLAGQYRGLVFTGIDITEELERKRLSNWAQLAHDMQTNLSTIKLNAEQLEFDEEDRNSLRRNKILHQTRLMIQRVRDIVTVGRTDALGMQQVNSTEICQEVRNEFDETLFPNIQFQVDCKSFKVYCDKPKLIRALRNAVENAIKAMPEQSGGINISCWNDTRSAYFSIKDDGLGMDQKIVEKMMTPYFTTAKEKGGYGMGTMIMQHVMELHAGKLDINSKKGEGTEVLFSFPNYIQKQK
jgi:PAS domain S-box-containing protein